MHTVGRINLKLNHMYSISLFSDLRPCSIVKTFWQFFYPLLRLTCLSPVEVRVRWSKIQLTIMSLRVLVFFSSSDVRRSLEVLVVRWFNCGLEKTGILCSFSVCFRVVFVCVWTTIDMFKCTCIKCDTVLPVNRTFDTLPFNSDPSFILYAIST